MSNGKVSRIPICGHPGAKHFGRGLCYECYKKFLRETGTGMQRTKRYNAKNYEAVLARARKYNRATYHTPEGQRRHRNSRLKGQFGITVADYDALLAAQNGVCAICLQPERIRQRYGLKRLSVDHDHETGKVRGLLCQACNQMLGHGRDKPDLLRTAAAYLEKQN